MHPSKTKKEKMKGLKKPGNSLHWTVPAVQHTRTQIKADVTSENSMYIVKTHCTRVFSANYCTFWLH